MIGMGNCFFIDILYSIYIYKRVVLFDYICVCERERERAMIIFIISIAQDCMLFLQYCTGTTAAVLSLKIEGTSFRDSDHCC